VWGPRTLKFSVTELKIFGNKTWRRILALTKVKLKGEREICLSRSFIICAFYSVLME
jgi:hypothetical protein